ncbi:hypothetical protein J5X98_14905 [Leptothermofonsia sichuanensis E412]|uniref:hypothetical protein n=1 Tax=Leptothermofonsia sichuanensis TaxID=2917832 RepID=UPI001CA62DD6|nr:hypothetical protein [Leptothermofonsia sichuanensis]QZZ18751.1 hypothetical protein J5X98_14905 [Leptothermofonsia sichuanensis E412]
MNSHSTNLTIHLVDASMTDEERNDATGRLLKHLKTMEEVNSVRRIENPDPDPLQKAGIAGTLIGLLMAEVPIGNVLKVLGFIGDRWGNKPIELELEINGRKLKIKASSREEFNVAFKSAQDFVAAQQSIQPVTESTQTGPLLQ